MDKFIDSKDNKFLKRTPENADFNQYWFSEKTIQFILNQIQKNNTRGRIALIATPSNQPILKKKATYLILMTF